MIKSKLAKMSPSTVGEHLAYFINVSITNVSFPNILKSANVSPIYRKKSLDKHNYRPVSVFERVIVDQLNKHLDNIFNTNLSVYRKGYSCKTILI